MEPVRDQMEVQTNRRLLFYAGCLFDGSWQSVCVSVIRILTLVSGAYFHAKTVISGGEDVSVLEVIESFHWSIVCFTLIITCISLFCQSKTFLNMEAIIKSGFYNYGESRSEKQVLVLKNVFLDTRPHTPLLKIEPIRHDNQTFIAGNEEVQTEINNTVKLHTNIFIILTYAAFNISFFKGPILNDNWAMPYPMRIPFEVNDWPSYVAALVLVWVMAEALSFTALTNNVVFIALVNHLIAQYRILIIAIKEIDDLGEEEASWQEKEKRLLLKIKKCVQHHNILIEFFNELQKYYNLCLLIIAFCAGVYICTMGYIVISDNSSPTFIASMAVVLLVELMLFSSFYCFLGQKLVNVGEELRWTVYNVSWFTMPVSVQRDLIMMMVACEKSRQLTGMGLHEFSMKGLSEILQASFTCFNMLLVLSGE